MLATDGRHGSRLHCLGRGHVFITIKHRKLAEHLAFGQKTQGFGRTLPWLYSDFDSARNHHVGRLPSGSLLKNLLARLKVQALNTREIGQG